MDNSAIASRAALDAARGVFGAMTGAGDLTGASVAAAGSEAASPAGRALAAWRAAEGILRTATGRTDLGGQALVGEARRTDRLTLGDAHVLIALHGWMERQQDPSYVGASEAAAPTDAERTVAREALLALEHAVATVQRDSARESSRDLSRDTVGELTRDPLRGASSFARPASGAAATASAAGAANSSYASGAPRMAGGAAGSPGGGRTSADAAESDAWTAPESRTARSRFLSPAFLIGAVVVLLLIAGGTWFALRGSGDDSYAEGATAYARGSREAASIAFARAAQENPYDARPLIYLGRIAREDGDLARSRRFLERAVRLAPTSAIAQREMASVMLADGNPEIARRFYIRSLEIDPTDRLSQGFLACALHRLGRFDDARRWVERAGTGEWTPCLNAPVQPVGPNGQPLAAPLPPR